MPTGREQRQPETKRWGATRRLRTKTSWMRSGRHWDLMRKTTESFIVLRNVPLKEIGTDGNSIAGQMETARSLSGAAAADLIPVRCAGLFVAPWQAVEETGLLLPRHSARRPGTTAGRQSTRVSGARLNSAMTGNGHPGNWPICGMMEKIVDRVDLPVSRSTLL